jgi:hypothetical protein
MAKKLTGGGILGNKNVSPPVRTGSPNRGSSAGSADQIGAAVSFKREEVERGRAYNSSILGNEKALDVGKGGPGAGRTVMKSGSQNRGGPPNQGEARQPGNVDRGPRAILGEKGSKV